jgi:hypothetical protein
VSFAVPVRGLPFLTLVAAALLSVACGRKIGDSCKSSIDCSQESERLCDISQPDGYCTVEGCDEQSCPDSAVCIRFFPRLFLTRKCGAGCSAEEICVDDSCAPRASERRYCAHPCGGDGDCRGGYQCRRAGTGGSLPLTSTPDTPVSFCAPTPP